MSKFNYDIDTWKIAEAFIKEDNYRSLVAHHLDSFNYFMDVKIDEIINHLTAEKNKRDIRDKNDQNSDQIEDTENDTIADNISSIGL